MLFRSLQFANYGPGAFYGSHYDSSDPSTKSDEEMKRLVTFYEERGERIATFMIYVSKGKYLRAGLNSPA